MKITEVKVYAGRNMYAHKKCIRMDLDLQGYCETPSCDIEGFNDNLLKYIPELKKHHCGIGEEGGFAKRLREGTYLAHICEHIIIALQNMIGIDAAYGKAREISGDRYYIVYQYEYKNVGLEAGRIAVDLINALINGQLFNCDERINELKIMLANEQLGPSTHAICSEAVKRGIPLIGIGEKSVFQLGYGKYSKLIEATICSDSSAIGVDMSCDKLMTKEILDIQCIPVARGGKVENTLDLLLKAESLGYPVVLKPRFGNQGKGVFVNIKDEKELIKAYEALSSEYKDIIIERHISGRDFRVCVVDGKVVACSERIAPYVIGDGISSIKHLVGIVNEDDKRGEDHEKPLTKIKIDNEATACIERQGYGIEDIPPVGERVNLRGNANLSTGGIAVDYTDVICEENKELCIRAAKAVGLNICGIDVCCDDISKPITEQGVIIEVNAAPGIRMHHHPFQGEVRNVAGAIVDMMFPEGYKRIPVVSVTGTNGKTTTTRLVGYALSLSGYNVGMTTTGGIYINNKCIDKGDTTGPDSALTILMNKDVEAAVLETARGGIVRRGLAYDLADVGVITNITEDHLGIDNIETMEQLALVKSLVVEAVREDGYAVINADDNVSATILERIKCKLILFSKDKNNELLIKHFKAGGIGIFCSNGYMYVQKGNNITPLIQIEEIGITMGGALEYNIENAMAATAACIGLGVKTSVIKKTLKEFCSNEELNPGRFNVYEVNGATVVLDYGHNIEGYRKVLEGVKKLKHKRLVGIIGVPGDRLDTNVLELGRISGNKFDHIYIKEDIDKRGRREGEIAQLLSKGVSLSNFNMESCEIILNEVDALSRALDTALPEDIIVVFFEKFEPLLKLVKERQCVNGEKVTAI